MSRMYFCFLLLKILTCLHQLQAVQSETPFKDDRARPAKPSCKNPQGKIGERRVEDCKQLVCVKNRNKASWRELGVASSVCCSYQQVGYQIGENITSSLAQDGCTRITLLCVEGEGGDPHVQVQADSLECTKCASKDDLDDLEAQAQNTETMLASMKASMDVMKASIDQLLSNTEPSTCGESPVSLPTEWPRNTTPASSASTPSSTSISSTSTTAPCPSTPEVPCHCNCSNPNLSTITTSPSTQDPELLFIGPGYYNQPSKVLNWPDLTNSNCSLPTSILPAGLYGYVVTQIKQKIMICGGRSSSDCYLLAGSGISSFAPMTSPRQYAAALQFEDGWWVMGGENGSAYLSSTEIYFQKNNSWVPSVNLPIGISAQCAVKLNATHVFMAGGYTSSGATTATYIYSKSSGFVPLQNMTKGIYYHSCALFEDSIYVIPGSSTSDSLTSFHLPTLAWRVMPFSGKTYGGELLVLGGRLTAFTNRGAIYQLARQEFRIDWYEWQKIGNYNRYGTNFKIMKISSNACVDMSG